MYKIQVGQMRRIIRPQCKALGISNNVNLVDRIIGEHVDAEGSYMFLAVRELGVYQVSDVNRSFSACIWLASGKSADRVFLIRKPLPTSLLFS